MNKIEIEVPINVRYISDWKDFDNNILQGHSIINKTITGCGFTHYTLTNDIPTILCSPRKFLLENKHRQIKDTYVVINNGEKGVFIDSDEKEKIIDPIKELFKKPKKENKLAKKEDYSEICNLQDDLRSYLINCQASGHTPKILVTYDSLKHVLLVLGDMIQYYSVIVDEFQNIFMDASFKSDTELSFLSYLRDCPNVTYLSATPYIEEYLNELDEFKDLPYYELKWHPDRLQTIKVDMRKTHHLASDIDKIIQDYLNGNYPEKVDDKGVVHQSKEVVFYTNSVTLIISAIKRNNLTPDQVNVICADTEKNKQSLKKVELTVGIAPLEGEPHKMFTFCTRTTYAGADFYSPCALSVVVSDCKIDSLSTDIRMDFPQIMGRQRLKENVFRDECIFIYKLSDSEVTLDQFEKLSKEKLDKTQADINTFNIMKKRGEDIDYLSVVNLLEDYRDRIRKHHYTKDYTGINEKTGQPIVNKLVFISERRAFELRSNVYKNDIQIYNEFTEAYSITGFDNGFRNQRDQCLGELKKICNNRGSFESKMKAVCDVLLDPYWNCHIYISDLYWLPLNYRNYLNQIGPQKIKALYYCEADIKREICFLTSGSSLKKIFFDSFSVGKRYILKDLKEKIREIYVSLGLSKTAKATDIQEYFEVKECLVSDKETGKRLKAFEIIKIKD